MKSRRQKLLLCSGVLVLLVVGFVIEEHYRGKWQLRAWRKQMAAQGEKFGIDDFIPPPAPAGDNGFFDLTAACARLSGNAVYQMTPPSFHYLGPGRLIVTRTLTEWKRSDTTWSDSTNSWRALEAQLSAYAEPLADAQAALRKPVLDARLPYQMGFSISLTHLARFRQLAQHLNSATAQDLHRGQLDAALENLEGMLALVRGMRDERLIITQLVRQSIASITIGTTWQALQAPGWNDAQLARLQQAWQSLEFIPPMARALEMERAIGVMSFGRMRDSADNALSTLGLWQNMGSGATGTNALRSVDDFVQFFDDHHEELLARNLYLPVWQLAWSYQDELLYLQMLQTLIDGARASVRGKSLAPSATAELQIQQRLDRLTGIQRMRYLVAFQSLPGLDRTASRAVVVDAQKELVVAAVALKRFQLRHHRPAPALSALVPEFLLEEPRDYCAGQPMRYRLTEDGGFLLYSVGRDGHDDGGNASPIEPSSKRFSFFNSRDLVWPRPATAEEVSAFEAAERRKK